jgi:hypothetical protein
MYAKGSSTCILDSREKLRVKIKSLAEESRIIRKEELRTHGPIRESLYLHRVGIVRTEARHSQLAFGIIQGKTLEQMEPNAKSKPNTARVKQLAIKYGVVKPGSYAPQREKDAYKEFEDKVNAWA